MRVASSMTPEPSAVERTTPIDEALRRMDDGELRHLPVLADGRLVGVLSDRDLLQAVGRLPRRVHEIRGARAVRGLPKVVDEVARAPVTTVEPRTPLADAARLLVERRIGCLPVTDGERLVGILTETDVLRTLARAAREGLLPPEADPPVEELIDRRPLTLEATTCLEEALAAARRADVRHFPVLEAGRLVGVLSDRDLRRALGVGRPDETRVDELMSREVVTIAPDAPLSRAATLLGERKLGVLLVVEDERLFGVLRLSAVLAHAARSLGGLRPGAASP